MVASSPQLRQESEAVRVERKRVISTLLAQVDELTEHAVAAIFGEIPAYAAAAQRDAAFLADTTEQVRRHYRTNLLALLEGRRVTFEDTAFVREAAARRARAGLELGEYLQAFRVGHQVLWDALLAALAETSAGPEAALPLAGPLMSYTDLTSTHAGQAYVEFWQYAVADADRERRDLLEQLLTGELPPRGPLLAVAQAYGIGSETPMVVAAAIAAGGQLRPDVTHAARIAIARADLGSSTTLVVVRHSEIIAVVALEPEGDPASMCAALDSVHARLSREGMSLAVGLSTPANGVADLPRAYAEAHAAMETVAIGGGVAALPRLSPFEYLALRADGTARRLVDPQLRVFLVEDRARGAVLINTIRAFAEADLNIRLTAELLGVHPNTAQYRLGRVRERTGKNPRRTRDLLDLLMAIALEEHEAAAGADA
jgi:PucR-like helix-turn-helix protein/diguanylate cyclase with GGDEF domain